ncbi:MAG TPA: poly-gamma-glutamate synthase PgsB [Syntrophorhabdaceae bacterium]|nr:poly-gamma-glutamate synthase PgsB [Syntrophorhabdaceae bacterium]
MTDGHIFLMLFLLLTLIGICEGVWHRRNLSKIPIRIHVNGTRGKSSVVRLIAGGLREAGIVTCAKTTGTLARMIMPDATEYAVFRPGGANIIEQVRIISRAASLRAQAVVVECMALQPGLQWFCESVFMRSTHGVITNARADHLDVMGPSEEDVAHALAGSTPVQAKLFTAERKYLSVFKGAAEDRDTGLIETTAQDVTAITDSEMEGFSYVEHRENVALSLTVCADLGIERQTALQGMWKAPPDPGVMTIAHIRFFGRTINFVNAFAANDPESTEQLWNIALAKFPDVEKRIIILNLRSDRPNRSEQLGKILTKWKSADHYLLIGTGTNFLARAAIAEGLPAKKLLFAEHESDSDIFETIIELSGASALVVGMGNAKGQGLSLVRFFHNRGSLKDTVHKGVS